LDNDSKLDSITDSNNKVEISGKIKVDSRELNIQCWVNEFQDILTEEHGLMDIVSFGIVTGDVSPIAQRPYNTPLTLREGVDLEIDWLLEKKYIRESYSSWASPIVTVKKPNGRVRLCVDFKQINEITKPLPFYMPRVEVLETVGKSKVISKLDLSKGYLKTSVKQLSYYAIVAFLNS